MQLNSVVLPAPFGPMMPTISHSSMRRFTSRSACTPPKRIDTSSVLRAAVVRLGQARTSVICTSLSAFTNRNGPPRSQRPDGAGELAEAAREQGDGERAAARGPSTRGITSAVRLIGSLANRLSTWRISSSSPLRSSAKKAAPSHDAGPVAEPADHRHEDEDEGEVEAEGVGHHVGVAVGEERAAESGEEPGHAEGEHGVGLHVDAPGGGDARVLPQGQQGSTALGGDESPVEEHDEGEHDEAEVVVAEVALEAERAGCGLAGGAAGERLDLEDALLGHDPVAERDEAEVEPGDAEGHGAEQGGLARADERRRPAQRSRTPGPSRSRRRPR